MYKKRRATPTRYILRKRRNPSNVKNIDPIDEFSVISTEKYVPKSKRNSVDKQYGQKKSKNYSEETYDVIYKGKFPHVVLKTLSGANAITLAPSGGIDKITDSKLLDSSETHTKAELKSILTIRQYRALGNIDDYIINKFLRMLK